MPNSKLSLLLIVNKELSEFLSLEFNYASVSSLT